MSVHLSPMKPDDLPEVLAIEAEAFEDPWTEKLFIEEMDGDARRLNVVMRMEDRLIGYGLGWIVVDEFHLGNLAVAERYRGQGYGRQLLDYLLQQSIIRGCRLSTLEVRASNQAAIGLYRSFGYREIAIRPNYYGNEDALVMMKELGGMGHGR